MDRRARKVDYVLRLLVRASIDCSCLTGPPSGLAVGNKVNLFVGEVQILGSIEHDYGLLEKRRPHRHRTDMLPVARGCAGGAGGIYTKSTGADPARVCSRIKGNIPL